MTTKPWPLLFPVRYTSTSENYEIVVVYIKNTDGTAKRGLNNRRTILDVYYTFEEKKKHCCESTEISGKCCIHT